MKINKKQIGIIAGLVCAIVLILLLLTMCNGSGNGDHHPTQPSITQGTADATEGTAEPSAATSEATEETTEPTEELTEATEETTEPTEETTEPTTGGNTTPGGNTKPGGSGGYVPDTGDDDDDDSSGGTVTEKAPAAGSEKSPYVERLAQIPDGFTSVSIPQNSTVYHHVYGAEGSVLSIEDPEAYVIFNGTTYEADEYGVVRVPILKTEVTVPETPEAPDSIEAAQTDADTDTETDTATQPTPQILQIGSKAEEARSFCVAFNPPLGSRENPEMLEAVDGVIYIETLLEAGDADGYFYSYTPAITGLLELQPEALEERIPCDILVTQGETVLKLSETENGILSVNLTAEEPLLIQVVALPDETGSYPAGTVSILGKVLDTSGSLENPKVLEATDGMIAIHSQLEAGDTDGIYYSYIPLSNGQLSIQVDSATENVAYDIVVTLGEEIFKLSDCEDGILAVDVYMDAPVMIQILTLPGEDGQYPAAELNVTCQIIDTSGSKNNPIDCMGMFPIVTDVLEPGEEVYYNVYGAGGMILTLADPDAYVIMGEETWTAVDGVVTGTVIASNPRMPVLIGIGNSGTLAESYSVDFTYKLGNMANPDQLKLETNVAPISAGSTDGYWYTWTAEQDGILTITMLDANWIYLINNVTTSVYGDMQFSDVEEPVMIAQTQVAAGDEMNIMVCTYDPENPFEYPAGEVTFEATFNTLPGTKDNPIWLWDMENTIDVQPNMEAYCNEVMSGVNMIVTGQGAFTVTYNGIPYAAADGMVKIENVTGTRFTPVPVILANYSTEAVSYTVSFEYPLGNAENPEIFYEMGEYTATVSGDGDAYFYNWSTLADGQFTITMLGDDWTYVVNNLTSFVYGDTFSSADGSEATLTLDVVAGDVLEIVVSTASYQSGKVPFAVDFYDPTYGTAENPVFMTEMNNKITVRPGTQVYANAVFGGANMTVTGPENFTVTAGGKEYTSENGVVVLSRIEATRFAPLQMVLTNDGDTAANYLISFEYPLGNGANPETITSMGQYTASVIGSDAGYFYTWTADLDGVLTVQMLTQDWTLSVNNITQSVYHDSMSSSGDAGSCLTVDVATGDEIQIILGTASGTDKEVSMELDAFDPNLGTAENPIWLTDTEITVTLRPGTPVYCNLVQGGTAMTISCDAQYAVSIDGTDQPVVEGIVTVPNVTGSRFMPQQMILTNTGDEKTSVSITFAYPVGHSMNPEIITEMGEHTASVIGDGEGYFYSWVAQADGEFTITMLSSDWIYVMHNLTSYHYGGFHDSTFGDAASETISVMAGDEIQINIGTSSRKNQDVTLAFAFLEAAPTEFEGSYTPKTFYVLPDEIQNMGPVDLTLHNDLWASKAGIYHLDVQEDPLVLLNFTDDTYVNLAKLVESTDIWLDLPAPDGTVTRQRCNDLLERYIECAWVVEVSEDVTATYYPLTEDLELILKALGEELGWYDPDSEGYLFAETEEETPEEIPEGESTEPTEPVEEKPVLDPDTLWMFACSYIEFVMDEDTAEETQPIATEPEAAAEPSEEEMSHQESPPPPEADTEPVQEHMEPTEASEQT